METHRASNEDIQHINRIIRNVPVAMLTTTMPDGSLHGRPMATQNTEFDGELWFFTELDTAKVHEIDEEHHVNVSYADHERHCYASLSGLASVVRDRARAKAYWTRDHAAWLGDDGFNHPNVALLRVRVEYAEIWEALPSPATSGKGSRGAGRAAKATATGRRDATGENTKLSMDGSSRPAAAKGEGKARQRSTGREAPASSSPGSGKREGDPIGAAGVVRDRRAARGSR